MAGFLCRDAVIAECVKGKPKEGQSQVHLREKRGKTFAQKRGAREAVGS